MGTDITVDRVILITGDATLCLNGNSITGKSYAVDVIGIKENVKFTLTDCKGNGNAYGKITHASDSEGRGISVGSNATFNMYGGSITRNTADKGGGVFVNVYDGKAATFTVSGNVTI